MALNLFSKTLMAHQASSSGDGPSFLICENDDRRAQAFLEDLRQKGGSELASRVNRVGSGRESVLVFSVIKTVRLTKQYRNIRIEDSDHATLHTPS
jgi:3-hydroxyisobutyrate dehydrogenase